jgi:hypothetical protein
VEDAIPPSGARPALGGARLDRRWRRRGDVTWRISMDRLIVAAAGARNPVTVHGSAAAVWALLDRPRSLAELAEQLGDRFGVAPAAIAADLAPTLADLAALGVLEEA